MTTRARAIVTIIQKIVLAAVTMVRDEATSVGDFAFALTFSTPRRKDPDTWTRRYFVDEIALHALRTLQEFQGTARKEIASRGRQTAL